MVAVLGSLIVGGIVIGVRDSKEVNYQGKTVTYWAKKAAHGDGTARAALNSLGSNAIPDLVVMLHTEDSALHKRVWAVQPKLPQRARNLLWRKLGPPLASEDRIEAARALGGLGTNAEAAVPFLAQALNDPNNQVSYDVAAAMGQIGAASTPWLIEATKDFDPNRRRAIVGAIGQIGPGAEAAVPKLIELLQDPDGMVRQRAAYALNAIGTPWITRLLETIKNGGSEAREAAANELLTMYRAPFQASKALGEMADDPSPSTRRKAIETFTALRRTDTIALRVFTNALTDQSADVRAAATNALSRLASNPGASADRLPQ
jgi:HEAT repeat protein